MVVLGFVIVNTFGIRCDGAGCDGAYQEGL